MKKILLGMALLLLFLEPLRSQDEPYLMGLPAEPDEFYEGIPLKSPLTRSAYKSMPTRASVKQYAPIPQNQGQYGTCAAWATAYAARTILEAQKNGWTDKNVITQNAFSYGYLYRLTMPTKWDCWGAFTSECIDNMQQQGLVKLADFNESCPQSLPAHLHTKAAQHKIKGYARLWESNSVNSSAKINMAKKALAEGNPIVISMLCPASFHRVKGKELWIPTETAQDPNHGRHAMCVVGFNDSKHGGAFEIQNSWGTGYGNGGYVWVRYDDFANFVYQAFELFQFDKPQPPKPELPKPMPPKPEPPKPQPAVLAGSLKLVQSNGTELKTQLAEKTKNFNIVAVGEYTYRVTQPTFSGTQFRIYLNNNEPAFVYLLGTGSVNKSVATLFPFSGFSAALNYKSNQVAIPNEDYYIELDNTAGNDYLILLYSKEQLDIENIRQKMENGTGKFSDKLKTALGSRMIAHENITFEQGNVSFKATAKDLQQTVVPIIVMFDHR